MSLASCAKQQVAVDSYCMVYTPVVQAKGEGSITASTIVKKRILANELTYREQCKPAGKT